MKGNVVKMSILIDKEFKALIPPLSKEEYMQLEENCVHDGIRDPLIVWPQGDGNDILIDGHNRFEISAKHAGIPYQIKRMDFQSRDEVIAWIIRNQLGRRNLSAYDRSILALRLKPVIAGKAKEKEQERKTTYQKSEKSNMEPVNTTKELATIAGVSHDTIHKVERIEAEAPESVKEALRQGRTTINRAYNDTFPKRPDPVKEAKEQHEAFQEKKQEQAVVSFQDVKIDKINQRILNNALTQDILKLINAVTKFGFEHKQNDLRTLNEELTSDYKAHILSELEKCKHIISVIETSLRR